jgi:hypothetical protein
VAWKSLALGRGRQSKTFAAATPAVGLLAGLKLAEVRSLPERRLVSLLTL